MKTLLLTLTTLILLSGCVYRAPGTTEHVVRNNHRYTTPPTRTYNNGHTVYTNGREKEQHKHHDRYGVHHISSPNTHSHMTNQAEDKSNAHPKVHPQHRDRANVKNEKRIKPKGHLQHQEYTRKSTKPKEGPKFNGKQKMDHSQYTDNGQEKKRTRSMRSL